MELPLPTISIITPSYNQGHFIAQTIESVAAQNYPGLEHWIIDGGSTDNTLEVLRRYELLPHLRWVSEKDRGQSDAINKGMQRATGTIVGWLNADDVYYDGALRAIGEAFRSRPDAGLIYGSGTKTDEAGNVLKEIPPRPYDEKRLRSIFYILQPSMFFRRDLYLEVGGLAEESHYAMDWELVLKLIARAPVCSIPEKISKLRCYSNTKTETGGWKRMREIAEIGRRFNGSFDRNYLSFRIRSIVGRVPLPGLKGATDAVLNRLFGGNNYMVHGWPE